MANLKIGKIDSSLTSQLITGNLNSGLKAEVVAETNTLKNISSNTNTTDSNLVTGDKTKSIKSVGELALRISRFDSYRLFTLYENVRERKLMDVSGDQKYYLVFKSPKKEIRIPEYDPKGFFEVDKVNGCVLFKITKKNAEDILSMKTGGERIFHIIRVFEERDAFGKLLSVTDEVEVYNGKWGDDDEFSAFSTSNKIDLLTKALAAQIDKNAKLFSEYNDLLEKYSDEVKKTSDLEKEIEALRSERDALQEQLNEYLGSTYDGTLLSTDTKYIAFENTMENISFTEEQLSEAIKNTMSDAYEEGNDIDDSPTLKINVGVKDDVTGLVVSVYKNRIYQDPYGNDVETFDVIGVGKYNEDFYSISSIKHGDKFKFVCTGIGKYMSRYLHWDYVKPYENRTSNVIKIIDPNKTELTTSPFVVTEDPNNSIASNNYIIVEINFADEEGYIDEYKFSLGELNCYIEGMPIIEENETT